MDNKPVEFEGGQDPFAGALEGNPFNSPVQPAQLAPDSPFRFHCHPGVSCFNECCRNIEIQLLPYDILRLKRRLGLDSREFVARYTVPFEMDHHGLPGLRLATKPGVRECVFLGEQGCTVYEDRPSACRYYALGSMGVRKKDERHVEDIYFVVREPHCKGHEEARTQTVAEYRREQGCEQYDAMNHPWRELVIKKRSAGPTIGKPSERSVQLFDMCSYDLDSFREFIQTPGFVAAFDIADDDRARLLADEEALLAFAVRFLRQVLFGEKTIALRAGAAEERVAQRRERMAEREQAKAAERNAEDLYEAAREEGKT